MAHDPATLAARAKALKRLGWTAPATPATPPEGDVFAPPRVEGDTPWVAPALDDAPPGLRRSQLLFGVVGGWLIELPLSDFADRWIAAASQPDGGLAPGFGLPLAALGCAAAGFLGTAFTACDPDEAVGRGARTGAIAGVVGALGALLVAGTVAASAPILHVAAMGPASEAVLVDQLSDGLAQLALVQLGLVLLGALGGGLAGGLGGAASAATGACERGRPVPPVSGWSRGVAAVLLTPLAATTIPSVAVAMFQLVQAMSANATERARLVSSFDTVAVLAWSAAVVLPCAAVLLGAGRAVRAAWRARELLEVQAAATLVALVSLVSVALLSLEVSETAYDAADTDLPPQLLMVGGVVAIVVVLGVAALLAFRAPPAPPPPSRWVAAEAALLIGPVAHALVAPTLVYGVGAALGMVAAIGPLSGQAELPPDAIGTLVQVTTNLHAGAWPLQLLVPMGALVAVQPVVEVGIRVLGRAVRPGEQGVR